MANGYALRWSGGTTDVVSCGTGASMVDIAVGTVMAWFLIPTVAGFNRVIVDRRGGTNVWQLLVNDSATTGDIAFRWFRATTSLVARTAGSTFPFDKPVCLAARWNANGANGDQQLWLGTMGQPLSQLALVQQVVGSGAHSDSGATTRLGGRGTGAADFPAGALIWGAQLWTTYLDLGALQRAAQRGVTSDASTVGAWVCDQTPVVVDRSGRGNHGLLQGGVNPMQRPYPARRRAA